MKNLLVAAAALGVASVLSFGTAQAAPLGKAPAHATVSTQSMVHNVDYGRRCHRVCYWRHHHRHCNVVCRHH